MNDPGKARDERFFSANPDRLHNCRPALEGELESLDVLEEEPVPIWLGRTAFILSRQYPDRIERDYFPAGKALKAMYEAGEVDESLARDLFQLLKGPTFHDPRH